MGLAETLNTQLKAAMKAKDKAVLGVLRMLKAALVNAQIKLGHDLSEDEERAVLATELKQRKDALADAQKSGRQDLVAQLEAEIAQVESFLPAQLSEAEVTAIVEQVVAEVGATSKKDLGQVMKALMPKVKGQADGALVNRIVQAQLN